ncbi:MAG TPA: Lrp/AsnC family transcriptional regulator [Pseudonocardiaceae bacterium]|jgi:DNA-binding Lrp family transcriptional regulator|nr:Lrp/AsnC family transcriptional regulator [Pseudonocardiaceae bacterium]
MRAVETESVVLDDLDRGLLHALNIDGRASFARIGEVLGVSDRTVGRRYARLRETNLVRLVGAIDAGQLGGAQWIIRVHCQPGSAMEIAVALARREDTRWVHLLSGGTEITASLQSWSLEERDDLILQRLQRTAPVVSVTAHSVLHMFVGGPDGFAALLALDAEQVEALRPDHRPAGAVVLSHADRPLVQALARDGRAPYPALAAATGWSESTVARRIEALRAAGLLYFDVDVDSEALGYHADVRLWASVPPAQLAETGAAIAAHPEVAFCAATTGPTNLLVSAVCRDNADLYRYLTERIGALPLVREVETAPVIRTVKRAGGYP